MPYERILWGAGAAVALAASPYLALIVVGCGAVSRFTRERPVDADDE